MRNEWVIFFIGVFFTILFLQSGLDKLFNWKSELEFNKEHFSKTFLKTTVPFMMVVLTCLELSSGFLSVLGLITLVAGNGRSALTVSFAANCLCATTFIALFLGQRIAKDYAGAQSLVSYFILAILGVCFSML
jgi:uncharacterized membrane protein YphA (DoxX/SURF4 family)